MRAALQSWFRPAHEARSAAVLEREKWLCLHPRSGAFKRIHIVLPCVLIQCCLGSIYSWSIFNAAMDVSTWHVPGTNAMAFLASVAFYGLSTSVFGAHIGRIGPFASVRRTLILLPGAWCCAAAGSSTGMLWLLLAGYGPLLGIGIAHGYLATTGAMQRWWPEKKGVAAGVAVAGFGVGAFVWTLIGKAMLDPAGAYAWSAPAVQLFFGGISFCLIAVSLPLLRLPPPGWMPPVVVAGAPATATTQQTPGGKIEMQASDVTEVTQAHVQSSDGMVDATAQHTPDDTFTPASVVTWSLPPNERVDNGARRDDLKSIVQQGRVSTTDELLHTQGANASFMAQRTIDAPLVLAAQPPSESPAVPLAVASAMASAAANTAASTIAGPAAAGAAVQPLRGAVLSSISRDSCAPDQNYTLPEAARNREFLLTALLVFGSSMPGVVFLSSSADMAQYAFGLPPGTAFAITALQNLVNFAGRLGFGWLSDRYGRKAFYILAAAAQTAAVAAMPMAVRTGALSTWLVAFFTIGALYGGTFGVLPALTAELFGSSISSATHGCMLTLWALSAVVGIPIFTRVTATITQTTANGAVHPAPEAYARNAEWLLALPALATLAACALNTRTRDRVARRMLNQVLRLRLPGSHVFVVTAPAAPAAIGDDTVAPADAVVVWPSLHRWRRWRGHLLDAAATEAEWQRLCAATGAVAAP